MDGDVPRRLAEAVERVGTAVARLRARLAGEADDLARRLAALAAERVALLTAP